MQSAVFCLSCQAPMTCRQSPFVKSEFLHKESCPSKNHHFQKSAETGTAPPFILCEPKMNIHRITTLWKTPVEKSVENVENYGLSTVISLL